MLTMAFMAAIDIRPDLILLDNRLPDGTGREVLVRLKSSATTAGIPVVIVSGDSGGEHPGNFSRSAPPVFS